MRRFSSTFQKRLLCSPIIISGLDSVERSSISADRCCEIACWSCGVLVVGKVTLLDAWESLLPSAGEPRASLLRAESWPDDLRGDILRLPLPFLDEMLPLRTEGVLRIPCRHDRMRSPEPPVVEKESRPERRERELDFVFMLGLRLRLMLLTRFIKGPEPASQFS